MADLKPTISVNVKDSCEKLVVTDTTGLEDSTINPRGWEGNNQSSNKLDKATIKITYPDGTTNSKDVTSEVPTPVSGEFSFVAIEDTNGYSDGEYLIEYTLKFSTGYSVTTRHCTYSLCNTACCVSNLVAKIPDNYCDCPDDSDLIDDVLLACGLLSGASAASGCTNSDKADKIIKRINRICEIHDCNC